MGISRQQALDCFRSDDLIGIGMEADAVRRRLHPEGVVSYAVESAVSITGVEDEAGEASHQRLYDEIRNTIDLGSTGVRLVGGPGSNCRIEWFEGILRGIRKRCPSLWIEALTPAELLAMAAGSGLDLRESISRLSDAGLDSIASNSEPLTSSLAEWLAVHRAAHDMGMRTAATLRFGAGETLEQRIDFLEAIYRLQEETGGFAAFVPVAAKAASGRELDAVTAVEQLKTLAVARVFLDNIENIQWNAAAQSQKVLQTTLRFGANDAGSISPEGSNVSEEDLRRIIRDAGFQPVQRDTPYRTMFLN
jgi:cyclic dehypoxanthinyl futalosine synthase